MKKLLTVLLSFVMIFSAFAFSSCGAQESYFSRSLFINGNTINRQNGKCGVVNKDGKEEIPYVYDNIVRIGKADKFFAERDNMLLIIDKKGIVKEIGPYKINYQIPNLNDGNPEWTSTYVYYDRNSKLKGLIKDNGEILTKPLYEYIGYYVNYSTNRMIEVRKNGKFGLINIDNGKLVVDCKDENPVNFINDIVFIPEDSQESYTTYYAVMDKNGNIKSPYKYLKNKSNYFNNDVVYSEGYSGSSRLYLTGIDTKTGEEIFRKSFANASYKNVYMGKYGFIRVEENKLIWYDSDGKIKKELDGCNNVSVYEKRLNEGLIYVFRLGQVEVYDLNGTLKYNVDLDDFDGGYKIQESNEYIIYNPNHRGNIIYNFNQLTVLENKRQDVSLKLGSFVYTDSNYEYGIESVNLTYKVAVTYKRKRDVFDYYDQKITYGLVSFDGNVILDNVYSRLSFDYTSEYDEKYDFVELVDADGIMHLYRLSSKKIVQSNFSDYYLYNDGYIKFICDYDGTNEYRSYFTDWDGNKVLSFLSLSFYDFYKFI